MKFQLNLSIISVFVLAGCGSSNITNTSSLNSSSSNITSTGSSNASSMNTPINDAAFSYALSTNRLQEVDFNINLDVLIESTNPQSRRLMVGMDSINQTQSPGTVEVDTTNDKLIYRSIPDSSNVGGEFRNLNTGIKSNGLRSKEQVDIAISTISVVDTWVLNNQEQFLLQYNPTTDVVSLSIANIGFDSENDDDYSLKKITVQYTDAGDLLVEVYEASRNSTFAYFSHLRFIQGLLYEWSTDIWSDGVLEEVPLSGGPGWFKAIKDPQTNLWMYWRSSYYNAGFNIQTPNGWIQTYVRIAPEDGNPDDDIAMFNQLKVSSGGLENDVLSFDLSQNPYTRLTFYPSALNGWSSIEAPLNSAVLKNLQDWNPTNENVTLYETTAGELIVDNGFIGDPISTVVRPHNVDDLEGNGFVAYVAESQIMIPTNYRDMLDSMLSSFTSYGLSYKHGDLTELFTEVLGITNNLHRLFNQFELNGVSGFATLKNLRDVVDTEMALLHSLPSLFAPSMSAYPSANVNDLPPVVIGGNSLISLATSLTGSVSFDRQTQTISTTNLSLSIPQTVLLTQGASYTLTYGWFVDGFITPIAQEVPVLYQGGTLTIPGNQTLTSTPNNANTYQLVVNLSKVNETSDLRISPFTIVPVTAFEELSVELVAINGLLPTATYQAGEGLLITISYKDIEAPSVNYLPLDLRFNGQSNTNVLVIPLSEGLTIEGLLSDFEIVDNLDTQILFDISQLTFGGDDIGSILDFIVVGTYTYTIEDTAGNVTVLSVIVTDDSVD